VFEVNKEKGNVTLLIVHKILECKVMSLTVTVSKKNIFIIEKQEVFLVSSRTYSFFSGKCSETAQSRSYHMKQFLSSHREISFYYFTKYISRLMYSLLAVINVKEVIYIFTKRKIL
jgi:hypothetical protein